MRTRLWSLIAILALTFALAHPAAAAGTGRIEGQITNGTASAAAPGVVPVTLHAMVGGATDAAAPQTTNSDADGRFAFSGIDTTATTQYVVSAKYEGITYVSDVVAFAAGESAKTIALKVFETTEKPDAVALRQQHVIVTPDGESGLLRVVEIAIVENTGDHTIVGAASSETHETIRLMLPADAYNVDFSGVLSSNVTVVPGGIAFTGPIAPGQTQLVVGYVVNYPRAYSLRLALPLATGALDVLVDDVGVAVKSQVLSGPTQVDIGGKKFLRLSGRDLPAQSTVTVDFSGAVGPAGTGTTSTLSLNDLVPFALALFALATAYLLFGARIRGSRTPTPRKARQGRPSFDDEDEDLAELPVG